MKKLEVLEFFGGYPQTAVAMDRTESAIRQWPDILSDGLAAQVIGRAVTLKGVAETKRYFPNSVSK